MGSLFQRFLGRRREHEREAERLERPALEDVVVGPVVDPQHRRLAGAADHAPIDRFGHHRSGFVRVANRGFGCCRRILLCNRSSDERRGGFGLFLFAVASSPPPFSENSPRFAKKSLSAGPNRTRTKASRAGHTRTPSSFDAESISLTTSSALIGQVLEH